MYPHKNLDWQIHNLESQRDARGEEPEYLRDLSRAHLSRGLYHGGGELDCNRALNLARKVLSHEPVDAAAMVLAGTALLGLGRPDGAIRYLEEAQRLDPEPAPLHLSFGVYYRTLGDRHKALKYLETACRRAPEDWETHLYLGRVLAERAREVEESTRLIERSQFHLVSALKLRPPKAVEPPLLRDIGYSCVQTGRYREAEKFFIRLRENPAFRASARFHLGLVAYHLGKYKNAIQYYRQYLEAQPDDPRAHTRVGMARLQLGEFSRARESCNRALLLRPGDVQARYTLGCTHLEEGNAGEAVRVFKETLQDHPEHMPSYVEMARIRRAARDVRWLQQALAVEAGHYDRLPPAPGERTPRRLTRRRIAVLLDELRRVGPSSLAPMLRAMELVQDEGVRFQIWEAACGLARASVADDVAVRLRDPASSYGQELGRQSLATATSLPEPVLSRGLQVEEEDLKKAAVERHPPTSDVVQHRKNLGTERDAARAYQALLLLSVATRRSRSGRRLLERWAATADPDLAVAARAGLAMYGHPDAIAGLRDRARAKSAEGRVDAVLRHVVPPPAQSPPRQVSDHEAVHCTTCGRTSDEAAHLMAGTDAVICDVCVGDVSRNRRSLRAADDADCSFCGQTHLEARGLYAYNGVEICSRCLELSLGLMEREEVSRFLSEW